jgi:hypothetical protein
MSSSAWQSDCRLITRSPAAAPGERLYERYSTHQKRYLTGEMGRASACKRLGLAVDVGTELFT